MSYGFKLALVCLVVHTSRSIMDSAQAFLLFVCVAFTHASLAFHCAALIVYPPREPLARPPQTERNERRTVSIRIAQIAISSRCCWSLPRAYSSLRAAANQTGRARDKEEASRDPRWTSIELRGLPPGIPQRFPGRVRLSAVAFS